jgi:hypothetical protein
MGTRGVGKRLASFRLDRIPCDWAEYRGRACFCKLLPQLIDARCRIHRKVHVHTSVQTRTLDRRIIYAPRRVYRFNSDNAVNIVNGFSELYGCDINSYDRLNGTVLFFAGFTRSYRKSSMIWKTREFRFNSLKWKKRYFMLKSNNSTHQFMNKKFPRSHIWKFEMYFSKISFSPFYNILKMSIVFTKIISLRR